MPYFIAVETPEGKKILLNADRIDRIEAGKPGTEKSVIVVKNEIFLADGDVDEVASKIHPSWVVD